jgi:hypothetical protein
MCEPVWPLSRQRSFSGSAAAGSTASAAWKPGAQWGMRQEDADVGAFFERLHVKIQARDPPRRVSSAPACSASLLHAAAPPAAHVSVGD